MRILVVKVPDRMTSAARLNNTRHDSSTWMTVERI